MLSAHCLDSTAASIEQLYNRAVDDMEESHGQQAAEVLAELIARLRELEAFFMFSGHSRLQLYCRAILTVLTERNPTRQRVANRLSDLGRAIACLCLCCRLYTVHSVFFQSVVNTVTAVDELNSLRALAGKTCLAIRSDGAALPDCTLLSRPDLLAEIMHDDLDRILESGSDREIKLIVQNYRHLYWFLLDSCPAAFPRLDNVDKAEANPFTTVLVLHRHTSAVCDRPEKLALLSFIRAETERLATGLSTAPDSLLHTCYQVASLLSQLRKLDAILNWQSLPDVMATMRVMTKATWHVIRHPWIDQNQRVHTLLSILLGLREVVSNQFSAQTQHRLTKQLRQFEQLTGTGEISTEINRVQCQETESLLPFINRFLILAEENPRTCRVPPKCCTALYKLASNFSGTGLMHWHYQTSLLLTILSACMELRKSPPARVINQLGKFCLSLQEAVSDCAGFPDRPPEIETSLFSDLLEIETRLMLSRPEFAAAHQGTPTSSALAGSIRHLLNAEADLKALFRHSPDEDASITAVLVCLKKELRFLSSGAHALKVYRVEALASVMLEVCELLEKNPEIMHNRGWQRLLLQSHRNLNRMLNQAAAHQETDNPRKLISRLYRKLDARLASSERPMSIAEPAGQYPALPGNTMISVPVSTGQELLSLFNKSADCSRYLDGLVRDARQRPDDRHFPDCLEQALKVQQRHFRSLQECLDRLLNEPVEGLCRHLQRVVRQVGNELDRQVRLQTEVPQTVLPRGLLAHLQSPLEHLIRHAVCHGLEPLQERREKGKPDTGEIWLKLFADRQTFTIQVMDDGRGIDQAQAGRGIGLDSVNRAVTQIGGRMEITSTPGAGCGFSLILPRMLLG